MQRVACRNPGLNQVLHYFVLAVDRDGAPGQRFEIDIVAASAKCQINAAMPHAFPPHTRAHTRFHQQVRCALLQHAGTYALHRIFPATSFDDNGIDAFQVQ